MTVCWPKPNRSLGFVDVLGMTGLVGLLVARFIPVAALPFWSCELRRRTGWPCPGCGLTRAAERVALGNIPGAWEANALGTVAALLFALAALISIAHLAFKLPVPTVRLTPREASSLRWFVAGLAVLNYAFAIAKAKFPALL